MKSISTVVYAVNDFEDLSLGCFELNSVTDNTFGEYNDVINFLDEYMVQPEDDIVENIKEYSRKMDEDAG